MEKIIVVDFGGQYNQLIARRVRDLGVYCEIVPYTIDMAKLAAMQPAGLIFTGGPNSVYLETSPHISDEIFGLNVPILGICYGCQILAYMLGGTVSPAETAAAREYGKTETDYLTGSKLFDEGHGITWMSHGDYISKVPEGFKITAKTPVCPVAAMECDEKRLYGVQFHLEVNHTVGGIDMLRRFLFDVCGCKGEWKMDSFIDTTVAELKRAIGDKGVVLGLSGGVDSSVAAALIHKAIGDQLTCVFVDNGLLRKDERKKVEDLFKNNFKMRMKTVRAEKLFLSKLAGVKDPERKRKIIGKTFVEVFDKSVREIGKVDFLAQGTLYPDVIESVPIAGNPASLIKSHHNVGGLPKKMKLKLLEPLRELFKDEVRALGKELGLSKEVLWRHPFPGPGLGVRVVGEITKKYLDILREADAILMDEMRSSGLYYSLWQAFAVFLPVKTVGVMGDERTYDNVIALRVVESQDAMTADWAHIPHDLLGKISNRIINEVKGVNRVVLDISSKPPATIEWE